MSSTSRLEALELRIGHSFNNRSLLIEALTHGSTSTDDHPSNQRMEFLGDRVLALCMASELALKFEDDLVGELAKRFNHLVSRRTCADVGRDLDLGSMVKMSAETRRSGGSRRSTVLADAVEALIAAVFLDAGWQVARETVLRMWDNRIDIDLEEIEDAKSRLQELLLGKGSPLPVYKVIDRIGPDHGPLFTVKVKTGDGMTAVAEGSTKREAEKKAAAEMLKLIGE